MLESTVQNSGGRHVCLMLFNSLCVAVATHVWARYQSYWHHLLSSLVSSSHCLQSSILRHNNKILGLGTEEMGQ